MLPVKAVDTFQPIYGLTAFAVLVSLFLTHGLSLAAPILSVMVAKVALDLSFHLWSITLYRRWTGQSEGLGLVQAVLVSFAEPFTFQLLRHAGALWGWGAFLSGRESWVKQHRTAIPLLAGRA